MTKRSITLFVLSYIRCKPKRVLFWLVLITLATILLQYSTTRKNVWCRHYFRAENYISCYYYKGKDVVLPSVDEDFSPSTRSIFFHETSCKRGLDVRQACAVEAAARTHPAYEVHVMFAAPIKTYNAPMKTLTLFRNVKFSRFNIFAYTKGTPIESFISNGGLNQSSCPMIDTADIMRYVTLYKFGGVYLDLDSHVVKSLRNLKRNWAARASDVTVAAGALSFSNDDLGRTVADKILRAMATNFRTDDWAYNSVGILTETLKQICATDVVMEMTSSKCAGFEVYDSEMFYPIRFINATKYFDPGIANYPDAYMHHIWSTKTHDLVVKNDSVYASIVRRVCPTVYSSFPEQFGKSIG